jgi:TolA-binding protein
MDCPLRAGSDLAERYVAGTASETEQAAFEAHYFTCTACFAEVQLLQDIRESLRPKSGHTAAPVRHTPRPQGWRVGPIIGLAAAAALVVGLAYWISGDTGAPPTEAQRVVPAPSSPAITPAPGPSERAPLPASPTPTPPERPAPPVSRIALLQQLALVVPPRYVPLAVRGGVTAGSFDAAMAHYVAGRHRDAAQALAALAEARPADADVAFFLGISELASGHTAAGREALTRAVTIDAEPYADEAHFYLGKAALRDGDVETARRELQLAVAHDAGPDGEAAKILAALAKLPN